jgi:hypothetical protein
MPYAFFAVGYRNQPTVCRLQRARADDAQL